MTAATTDAGSSVKTSVSESSIHRTRIFRHSNTSTNPVYNTSVYTTMHSSSSSSVPQVKAMYSLQDPTVEQQLNDSRCSLGQSRCSESPARNSSSVDGPARISDTGSGQKVDSVDRVSSSSKNLEKRTEVGSGGHLLSSHNYLTCVASSETNSSEQWKPVQEAKSAVNGREKIVDSGRVQTSGRQRLLSDVDERLCDDARHTAAANTYQKPRGWPSSDAGHQGKCHFTHWPWCW